MNKEQERILNEQIRETMTNLRNNSIVVGMKSALGAVLDICQSNKSNKRKLKEIEEFCERGLYGNEKQRNQ